MCLLFLCGRGVFFFFFFSEWLRFQRHWMPLVRGLVQADCGGDHTHTTHTLLTHSLTVIIWPLEGERLRGCYSPPHRVQIAQLANESDWPLDLIKCVLHTSMFLQMLLLSTRTYCIQYVYVKHKLLEYHTVWWVISNQACIKASGYPNYKKTHTVPLIPIGI